MHRRALVRSIVLGTVVAIAGALAPSVARARHASGPQDFVLVNQTGETIREVYVSPSKADDWEEDILGRDVLEDGESVKITFHDRPGIKLWDLKAVVGEKGGRSHIWYELNLMEIEEVTIYYKNGKAYASKK